MKRHRQVERLQHEHDFDVVVLGAGINGACLYDALCRRGYRVLLVDKSDFGSGTSQASGMMIWGGLLYLRNLEFSSVLQLSHDRDRMIAERIQGTSTATMRYVASSQFGRPAWWVQSGLWLY